MADKAREWTDKKLAAMEKRIERTYKHAHDEITEKWGNYMARAQKRTEGFQKAYEAALKGGDADKIKAAKEKLEKAKRNVTFRDQYYKDMVDETTKQLANVNSTALAYVNGQMPSIYTVNYNLPAKEAEELGIDFKIVNEQTVSNLIKQREIKLPSKKLDIPKDRRWNAKQLNSSVLQGILQGESMSTIAKRILPIVDNNKAAAIRNARTMVTGSENRGRQDSYKELENLGAIVKKVWIATGDSRTRDWHLTLDGQEVDTDKTFIDGNGNKIRYPGDPTAAPETVYNCRCSMKSHILGVRKADGTVTYFDDYGTGQTRHQQEIEKSRKMRSIDGR